MVLFLGRRVPVERHHARPGLSQRPQVLVLPLVQHLHFPRRAADRADMARLRVLVLSQRSRPWPQRPQAEGAEARPPGQAGVRGHVHDGGQGLGWGTHLRSDYHRPNSGELPA